MIDVKSCHAALAYNPSTCHIVQRDHNRNACFFCENEPVPFFSAMQFLSVASHVCSPASGYHDFVMSSCRYSHRELPPHYIVPMLGTPQLVNLTRSDRRKPPAAAGRLPPTSGVKVGAQLRPAPLQGTIPTSDSYL